MYGQPLYCDYPGPGQRLVCRLVNYDANRELLMQVPHRRFLDLAVVYYYRIIDGLSYYGKLLIRNEQMERWGVPMEQMDKDAMENTIRISPCWLTDIKTLCKNGRPLDGESHDGPQDESLDLYILTNREIHFGSVMLLYPEVIRGVSSRLGGDFYVLPSSVHECMVTPYSKEYDVSELRKIVQDMNAECTKPDKILGNNVYRYFRIKETLELAE